MRYIKVFVSSTKANELISVIDGITKQMMIPVRMFDSGVGMEGSGQMWIKLEVCDDSLTWDNLEDRVDRLNNHGKYADGPANWAMPCEIEVYDTEAED